MKISWRTIILWTIPALVIAFFLWQGTLGQAQIKIGSNTASARMSYGRFLDYLQADRVTSVDLYDNGRVAIVEAVDPELNNRVQILRVDLPVNSPYLISRLRESNINFDIHPPRNEGAVWGLLGNLIFPILLIVGLFFLFRRSSNVPGGPGQAMNFGKSKARFSMEAKTGVLFDDVAGVDEAKEELQEVVTFLKKPERFTAVGEQTLNQLLTEMDGFEGNSGIIIIAATNRPDVLDSALLRPGRFDRQVTVDAPDIKGRLSILNVHARNKKLSNEISLEAISRRTPGFTGADLANLLNEAAILTARRRKEAITMLEINDAVDRVVAGMEGTPLMDGKSKRLIAYHEVGHAIVGTLLKEHDPVQKVTLVPRGQARGLTWFMPNEEQGLISRSQILARITGALGGRAAEKVIFGDPEVTTGASNDLQQVTGMARQMVTRYGMSDLGPMSLETQQSEVFLGRDLMTRSEYSDEIASRIDAQVRTIVEHCYEDACHMMRDNRVVIDRLVDLLIEKETIDGDEFRQIVAEYTNVPEKESYVPVL